MIFKLKAKYNFTVYAPALFSDTFRQVKVIGIIDYETAKTYQNIDLMQRQIYPLLPQNTPDRVEDYTYILLETSSGIKSVIAYPWIIENSIQEITSMNLVATIYDSDDSDMGILRDFMNSMGYRFKIEQIDI